MNPSHMGKIEKPDGFGTTKNLRCGDILELYIKTGEKQGERYIKDVKFTTLGCGTAIAASDMICELAKGKTLTEAKKISYQDIADKLGKVPPVKIHCTHLAERALKEAIKDYEEKRSQN